MKKLRLMQSRAKTVTVLASVQGQKKRWLIRFCFWLTVGFTIAALVGLPVRKSLTQSRLKLDRFDVDVYPAINIEHVPPLITTSGETVKLEFNLVCGYIRESSTMCKPVATLYATYGPDQAAEPIALMEETHDGIPALTASLPASNAQGEPLHYYLEANDSQFDLTVRYPVRGTIDLFVVPDFTPVALPEQKASQLGEPVLTLPWGIGPEEVGMLSSEEYPRRAGPSALDVAPNGQIALLDNVNQRVLIFHPDEQSLISLPVTFPLKAGADVQFDRQGQIGIFDPSGERIGPPKALIPQLYRLSPGGHASRASVFVKTPAWLTPDLSVIDLTDGKLVVPFNDSGEANDQETQRQKRVPQLLLKYVSDHEARFADSAEGIAFQVRSKSPLGAISLFERVPQGYLAVFRAEHFRAVWFDVTGRVIEDVTVSGEQYTEINLYGQVVTDVRGALYVLSSTVAGVQVRLVKAPHD